MTQLQMIEKRREAAERRLMAAERLNKSGVTTVLKENGTQQYDPNLQAKPEIQDGGATCRQNLKIKIEVGSSCGESTVLKQNCIVM